MNNKGRQQAVGLGAVMGSKKVKAIAVKGSLKVPLADEAKANELRRQTIANLTGHITILKQYGTRQLWKDVSW